MEGMWILDKVLPRTQHSTIALHFNAIAINAYLLPLDTPHTNHHRIYTKFISPSYGYGLFASSPIPAQTVLGMYTGVLLSHEHIVNSDYGWNYPSMLFTTLNSSYLPYVL